MIAHRLRPESSQSDHRLIFGEFFFVRRPVGGAAAERWIRVDLSDVELLIDTPIQISGSGSR